MICVVIVASLSSRNQIIFRRAEVQPAGFTPN